MSDFVNFAFLYLGLIVLAAFIGHAFMQKESNNTQVEHTIPSTVIHDTVYVIIKEKL